MRGTISTGDTSVRVLHVDDEPDFADMIAEHLELEDSRFEVTTATGAEEALKVLGKGENEDSVANGEQTENRDGADAADIDCVVSDYSMPGTDGLELLEEVRDSYPDLPFILFTGKGSEEVASEAISAGVTDYLQKKPGTEQYPVLANRIQNAVNMRRSERELRETSKQLRAVLDTVSAAVFLKDAEGRYMLMNQNCREMLGVEDDVTGMTDHDILPDEVAEMMGEGDRRVLEEGETVEVEEEFPSSDGNRVYLTLKSPVPGDDGEPYAVCGVSTNITERREREKELIEQQRMLDTVLSNVSIVMFALDENGVFTRSQGKALEEIGLEPGEVVGESIFDLYEDRQDVLEQAERALEGESVKATVENSGRTFETWYEPLENEDGSVTGVVGLSYDITVMEEREKELEKYEAFVENSSDVIVHLDEDGTMLYQSPGTKRIFGHEPGVNLNENVFEYIHPDDHDKVFEKFSSLLGDSEKRADEVELRAEDEDGSYVWVEAAAVDQTHTEFGGVVVSLRDITEKKEREQELELYEGLVENTTDLMTLIDEDGTILYQSPSAEPILGYDPENATGYNVFDFVHPENRDYLKGIVSGLVDDPEVEFDESEYRFRHGDGSYVWLEGKIVDRRDTNLDGFLVVARDVTERKEREEELRRLKERLDLAVEGANLGIWDWDIEAGEVTYNDEWTEMLGVSREESGSDFAFWEERVHPEDAEELEKSITNLIKGESEQHDAEYRMRTADGGWKWIHTLGHIAERDEDGRAKRAVGVHMDVDERKRAERALEEERDMFAEGPAVVFEWGTGEGWPVEYVSDNIENLLVYTKEEMEGVPFADLIHEDDLERVKKQEQKVARGELNTLRVEPYRVTTKDGDVCWVMETTTAIKEGGEIDHYRGYLVDVTKRKEREKELERYEAYIENSSDIITHLDMDGTILYQSPSAVRILGHEYGERVGDNAFDYVHPDYMGTAVEEFTELLDGSEDTVGGIEMRYERDDGSYVWLEITGSDQRDTEVGGVVVNSREITERKEYEDELERSKDLLRRTEQVADTGGWEADLETEEVRWTSGMYDIFDVPEGYRPTLEESIESYHPEDRNVVARAIEECREDGEPFDEELRISQGDGVLWVHVRGEPIRENGEVTGIRGSVRDITEMKGREKELERSQDLLRKTEHISDTGGWEIDLETGEQRWTEGTYRIHGVSDDYEPTVEKGIEFYQPDDREVIRDAVERCREDGEPYDEELRFITADGELRWVHTSGEPVYEGGDIAKLRGSIRDITEEKERETELLRNNKSVRELYEITADPDLSFEDKIEMVLESCRSRLGLPYAFVTEIDTEAEAQTVTYSRGTHELLQPGESCPLEQSYCRRTVEEGGLLAVQDAPNEGWEGDEAYEKFGLGCYIGAKLTVGDGLYGTLCFADTEPRAEPFTEFERTLVELMANWVSYELERKRSEDRLRRQKERLDDFASVVSHDLRSPLAVLRGNLELSEETGNQDHFDSCREAVDRMEAIIEDLLSLARDVDDTEETEAVDLNEVVDECWRNIDTKQAELHVETESTIMADRGKLRQMFENLLRNSVEHGGDRVTITVSDLPDGFHLEDDGSGISEEERDRVFEPGYTTRESGTGLGMYIVKQVAEAHGWDVEATEGENGGAAFEVTGVEEV